MTKQEKEVPFNICLDLFSQYGFSFSLSFCSTKRIVFQFRVGVSQVDSQSSGCKHNDRPASNASPSGPCSFPYLHTYISILN